MKTPISAHRTPPRVFLAGSDFPSSLLLSEQFPLAGSIKPAIILSGIPDPLFAKQLELIPRERPKLPHPLLWPPRITKIPGETTRRCPCCFSRRTRRYERSAELPLKEFSGVPRYVRLSLFRGPVPERLWSLCSTYAYCPTESCPLYGWVRIWECDCVRQFDSFRKGTFVVKEVIGVFVPDSILNWLIPDR